MWRCHPGKRTSKSHVAWRTVLLSSMNVEDSISWNHPVKAVPGTTRAAAPVAVIHRQLFELPHAVAGHQRRPTMRLHTCSQAVATAQSGVRTTERDLSQFFSSAKAAAEVAHVLQRCFSDGLIDTSVDLHGQRLRTVGIR
jgi:hypothetical protein